MNETILVQRRQNHRELPEPPEARSTYSARPTHLSVDVSMEGFPVYVLRRNVGCLPPQSGLHQAPVRRRGALPVMQQMLPVGIATRALGPCRDTQVET